MKRSTVFSNGDQVSIADERGADNIMNESGVLSATACIAEWKSADSYRVVGHVERQFILITARTQELDSNAQSGAAKHPRKCTLFAIDQHAASERCEYEKILRTFSSWLVCQPLKAAFRVHASVQASDVAFGCPLNSAANEMLAKYGFNVNLSSFDGKQCVLKVLAVPKLCATLYFSKVDSQLEKHVAAIEELINTLLQGRETDAKHQLLAVAKRHACVSAVRFGDVLSDSQTSSLLTSLLECTDPAHCAHGRPTIAKLHSHLDINYK